MNKARLIRRRRIRAFHHYGRADWTADRNRAAFGDQVKPHEHEWTIEVRIVGPIDPETGFCADLSSIDAALDSAVDGWEGSDLNEIVPPVKTGLLMPSTEVLAQYLFAALAPKVSRPSRLESIGVFESDEVGSEYPADGSAS